MSYCLSKLAGYLSLYSKKLPIENIAVDSRCCTKDSLFVALKGEKVDGHLFLDKAAKNGAVAAIVDLDYEGEPFGLELIRVKEPLKALQEIAKEHLKASQATVIGITGSIGKTTIKEMMAHLLAFNYRVAKTEGSMNGQIGVPLSILNQKKCFDVLVLEMGMSYKNEMDVLIEIAPCHLCVVGKVAPVHYEHFSSVEEIACEKAKLFNSKKLIQGFVHPANLRFKAFDNNDPKIKQVNLNPGLKPPFLFEHLNENFMIALEVATYLGVGESKALELSQSFQGAPHRFEMRHCANQDLCFIDDSYNSNPMAVKAALYAARKLAKNKRMIAILGEMKELGSLSKKAHEEVGVLCSYLADELLCFGQESLEMMSSFRHSEKPCAHFTDKEPLVDYLRTRLQKEDVILVKGSNSNRMWEVIDFLKIDEFFF